jgi:hypothetical protein
MTIVQRFDLEMNQRATFNVSLVLTDTSGSNIDISGWSFTGSIKNNFLETSSVANFTTEPLPELSAVVISMPPSETAKLVKRRYVYDIIATNVSPDPDEVYRILEGKVKVDLAVTNL